MHPYAEPLADLFRHLIPEMVLVVCACALFIGGLYKSDRNLWGGVAVAGVLLALLVALVPQTGQSLPSPDAVFGVPLLFDSLAQLTRILTLVTGVIFLLLCWHDLPEGQAANHHACFLSILAGVSLVGSANDLVALFAALELVSIPTYVLLYLPRADDAAQEASLKYFLLSVFSSAFLLFGFSYLFGLCGTTNIAAIQAILYGAPVEDSRAVSGLAQISMLMIAVGLGFRITAVPFHFYAPDVYQGATTSGAAFLSYIPKLAGFVALLRVFGFIVPSAVVIPDNRVLGISLNDQVPILFWFLAALSMTIGNILALWQDNLKRLLAYSSVAHAGYMLVALASAPYLTGPDSPTSGVAALLFYLVAYGTMTFGTFAAILILHRPERPVETVDDLAGLSQSHPATALMLTVLMLSFIGIPFTAGFTGKFFIFFGALSVQGPVGWLYPSLAVLGFVAAAAGAWYYLRIVSVMYLRTAVKPVTVAAAPQGLAALIACVVLTIALSIPPGARWLWDGVHQPARPAGPAAPVAQHQEK
jgi:NADH-quinone oxidoreductase subunit N